ncbi:MAG: peptidoglycan editing factor PgeF [Dehalococcoidales bacterium]|nr:peptidoglycan editing factor PgeF [Dehalococcoidales bacterium]
MNEEAIRLYGFSHMAGIDGLVHAVSGRQGGVSERHFRSLNLSTAVPDRQEAVFENRRRLAVALGIDPERLLKPGQVHGTECLVVGRAEITAGLPGLADSPLVADGLLTAEPDLYLFMTFADCVPVLLCDPVRRVVGLVHAGWKGTVAGAARHALQTAAEVFGCRPQDVLVGVGPSIGPDQYEVGEDVAKAARRAFPRAKGLVDYRENGKAHLDLWRANAYQLEQLGVPGANIEISGLCTASHTDLFFSHRAEKGNTGRLGAVIGLRSDE